MRTIVMVGAALLFGQAAMAQDYSKLTLDQALSLAKKSDRDLAAAQARLEQAEAAVPEARAGLLPGLVAQGKLTHNYKAAQITIPTGTGTRTITIQLKDQVDGTVAANVPILAPAAWEGWVAAKKNAASAEASTNATDAELLLGVAQSFYAAAGADEVLAARDHAVAVAQKTLEDAKVKVDAGTANKVESTRAELALVQAQQAQADAGEARDRAYRALATLLQLRTPFSVVAPEPPGQGDAVDALVASALAKRPELAADRAAIEAARAQSRAGLFRYVPSVAAFGNAREGNYAGFTGDRYSWAVGGQLDWTLFDGGAGAATRRQARALQREKEIELAALTDSIRDEIADDAAEVQVKRRALDTATRSVTLSQQTLDLVRAQHEAGTATQLDLLQAQDSLVAAQVALARSRFDLGLSHLALERAAGRFPEETTP